MLTALVLTTDLAECIISYFRSLYSSMKVSSGPDMSSKTYQAFKKLCVKPLSELSAKALRKKKRLLKKYLNYSVVVQSSTAHDELLHDARIVKSRLSGDPKEYEKYIKTLNKYKKLVSNDMKDFALPSFLK
eukprot:11718-Heterococcus_DN1.PRE.1